MQGKIYVAFLVLLAVFYSSCKTEKWMPERNVSVYTYRLDIWTDINDPQEIFSRLNEYSGFRFECLEPFAIRAQKHYVVQIETDPKEISLIVNRFSQNGFRIDAEKL